MAPPDLSSDLPADPAAAPAPLPVAPPPGSEGPRLGRAAFFLAWGVLTAAQVGCFVQAGSSGGAAATGLVVVGLILQIAKIVPTVRRLRDLGRPVDDAVYALVPPLNAALWTWLLAATPTPARREVALRRQVGLSALDAWRAGLRDVRDTSTALVLPTLALGAGGGAAVEALSVVVKAQTEPVAAAASGLGTALPPLTGFLALYLAIQTAKSSRTTRASWLPVLLLAPAALWTVGLSLAGQRGQQIAQLQMVIPAQVASLLVGPVVGALLAGLWILAARRDASGAPAGLTGARDVLRGSTLWGLIALWGLRSQATGLLFQLTIIGGIWFGVSWALADVVALLEPGARSLQVSTALVRAVRPRVFKALVIWFALTVYLTLAAWIPMAGFSAAISTLMGADLVSHEAHVLASVLGTLVSWPATLAMAAIYRDRRAAVAT